MSDDHSWWRSFLREFCWPLPGPGGSDHPLKIDVSVGTIALGTFSLSVNGERISGLVGKTSVKNTTSPMAVDVAANAPSADSIPRLDRLGTQRSFAATAAAPVTPRAPTLRTVRRAKSDSRALSAARPSADVSWLETSVVTALVASVLESGGSSISSGMSGAPLGPGLPRVRAVVPERSTRHGSRCVPLLTHRDLGGTLRTE